MTKESLAAMLNGRQMGDEITAKEKKEAKAAGLVVVFGYSDDNVEFNGAADEEVACYDEGSFDITTKGNIIPDFGDDEELTAREWREFEARKAEGFKTVKAFFGKDGYSWTFATEIPHATFDIMEDGEKFCLGIVFSLNDLTK